MLRLASRRLLLLSAILALSCGVALAGSVGACTSITTVSGLPTGAGNYCTLGNFVFANFVDPAAGTNAIPGNWAVSFQQSGNTFELTFTQAVGIEGGGYLSGGTGGQSTYEIGYNIRLIPGLTPPGYDIGGGWLAGDVGLNTSVGSPHGGNAELRERSDDFSGVLTLSSPYSPQVDFSFLDGVTTKHIVTGVRVFRNNEAGGITLTNAFIESTPEPASCALLGLGLATLAFLKRRRAHN